MKHTLKTLFITVGLMASVALPLFTSPTALAANPCKTDSGVQIGETNKGDCTEKTAFKFGACGNTNVGISCLVASTMQFLSILVGILVVGGITVGGIIYSTGGGNPGQTKKGVTIITNSVIGLVLYLLMFAIINFLIPGGVLQ